MSHPWRFPAADREPACHFLGGYRLSLAHPPVAMASTDQFFLIAHLCMTTNIFYIICVALQKRLWFAGVSPPHFLCIMATLRNPPSKCPAPTVLAAVPSNQQLTVAVLYPILGTVCALGLYYVLTTFLVRWKVGHPTSLHLKYVTNVDVRFGFSLSEFSEAEKSFFLLF